MHWKSGSPWPSLRGALYDWYLAAAGGFWGARAATGGGAALHIQLDRDWRIASARLAVLNRGITTVPAGALTTAVHAFDASTGNEFTLPSGQHSAAVVPELPPQSIVRIDGPTWPASAAPGAVLLWRIALVNASSGETVSENEYLLSSLTTDQSVAPNLTALAAMRGPAAPSRVELSVTAVLASANGSTTAIALHRQPGLPGEVAVLVSITAPPRCAVSVGVRVLLHCSQAAVTSGTGYVDDRVLPQFADAGLFTMIPGETRSVVITARNSSLYLDSLFVTVAGWNVAPVRANVTT